MNFNIRIDLSKVDQAHVFAGKNGARYLDIALLETKPSNFGDQRDENTHMAVQSLPKQERDAGKKGAILGNMKPFGNLKAQDQQKKAPHYQNKPATPKTKEEDEDFPPF